MQPPRKPKNGTRVQRFHFWLGVIAGIYFLILAFTGVALNHRMHLHLEEQYISHGYLPSHYRPTDEGERTRMDIVIADLHSGLLFGKYGPWINDAIALILAGSTLTGFVLAFKRSRPQVLERVQSGGGGSSLDAVDKYGRDCSSERNIIGSQACSS